jgi:hypothetical protein
MIVKYPKQSLYGLTLTKPLRQFHDLQRSNHQLISKTLILVIEPKEKKYNFRTIRAKPSIAAATTDVYVASEFTTHQ